MVGVSGSSPLVPIFIFIGVCFMAAASFFEKSSKIESKQEKYCVKPSIIIGLGGTGTEICLKLKTLINEKAGNDFPLAKFLIFDTDITDVRTNAQNETVATNQVKALFTPSEFYHLKVKDVAGIIKNADKHPHIFSWFSKDFEAGDILSGANQIRMIGRFALYWNMQYVVDAINRVKKEVASIKNKTTLGERGFEIQDGISVYILTSLCGGSGSGMFLDLGYLIREYVEGAEVNGCFVMPSAFQIEQQNSIEANAYAALKELDYFMSGGEFKFDIGPLAEPKVIKSKPYDRCYLVDSWTEACRHLEGVDNIAQIAANSVFYDFMTVSGKKHRSLIDNVKYKFANKICDKTTAYSSFGLASIVFDNVKVKNTCASILAEDFFGGIIKPFEKKDVKTRILEFIRINKINEELTDDVINFMRFDGKFKIQAVKNPKDFDAFSMDKMLGEMQSWHASLKNITMPEKYKIMDKNCEELIQRISAALDKETDAMLAERKIGIAFAEQFLISLDLVLKAYFDIMSGEAQKLREQKKQVLILLKTNKIVEMLGSLWSYIMNKSKIIELRDDLVLEMAKDINLDIEVYIRELAMTFYKKMSEKIAEILKNRISSIKELISDGEKKYEKAAYELLDARTNAVSLIEKKVKCSSEEIKKIYQKYVPANLDEIIEKFLTSGGCGQINEWDISKKEEITEKIYSYCASFFEGLDNILITDLFKEDASLPDVVEDIMQAAAPMWSYSTVEMPSGTLIDEIVVISINDEARPEFAKYMREQNKSVFNSTVDKNRITVIRFRHGLPLFALTSLKRDMKPAYDMFKSGGNVNAPKKPLHISCAYEELPDISLN